MKPTRNNCCVILDNTQLNHITLWSGGHLQHGDGDLVGVLAEAEHHCVDSVWGQVRDSVGVHLMIHLEISFYVIITSN